MSTHHAVGERTAAELSRRALLASTAAGAAASILPRPLAAQDDATGGVDLHLAPFRVDVTPPAGHSLCGGWIKPVAGVDDPLQAIGLVLLGAGRPIVLCAVDWTGILNSAHVAWRTALAEAAGGAAQRVAVHCVHQHNAPFACLDAQKIVGQYAELPPIVDVDFHRRCLDRLRAAVAQAIQRPQRITHIAHGQGRVDRVASNRRILGEDGKVQHWRGSSSRSPLHKELPEGLIDPWLKTVAFYSGEKKVAACHYYATHPMSYYGDGQVSSDFAGLARKRRQRDEPECTHLYFTGAAGNVAAGKYNDGSKQARQELTDRVYQGIVRSEEELERSPLASVAWKSREILPPPSKAFSAQAMAEQIANDKSATVDRNRPAYTLAYIERFGRQTPIVLSLLKMNDIALVHLPAESFVEYQLFAQAAGKGRFIATAAYGDGGPWYIPTAEAYPQGGYEVGVAFCDPAVDGLMKGGIKHLLESDL